jgi:hypothetical protein
MKKETFLSEWFGKAALTAVLVFGLTVMSCGDKNTGDLTSPGGGETGGQYTVAYTAGLGGGTAPASKTVIEGTEINLPAQGSMTAPSGAIFDGWKDGGGTTYTAGKNYTVNANVTFTAQWEIIDSPGINVAQPLKAVAFAASASTPKVLDSYTDKTGNHHYLIEVGNIRNTYISTILIANYNGLTPMSLSKTTISETTVANSITDIVSTSITTSDTQSYTVGIEAAWKKKFPVAGTFSAKLKYQWTGSWTNSKTETNSIETSYSTIKSLADSITTSFTIGEHGEPAGWHRYALYAVCDVYFVISTSSDKSQLLGWDTVVSARDDTLLPHMEYSQNGLFDNSPEVENTINFSDDFFKSLPTPTKNTPEPPPSHVKTSSSIDVYDGDAIRNDEKTGHKHTVNRPVDLDIDMLKALGYKKINIQMSVEIRAQNKGDGRQIWLDIDNSRVWGVDNLNVDKTSWYKKEYTHSMSINSFSNTSQFRFGFDTKDYVWTDAIWWFNTAIVTFTAVK